MDAATIGRGDACNLGAWLYGDGKRSYGSLPSYQECLSAHADFHGAAGKVATAINDRRYPEAEAMLDSGTTYPSASHAVATALLRLKKAVKP